MEKESKRGQGKQRAPKKPLDVCVEAHRLFEEVSQGHIDVRASAEKFQGKDREVLKAVNQVLDAVGERIHWYEQLLDAIPFPLSVTDKEMNWTFINKPVETFLGVKRADVVGKQCHNWNANICKTENCGIARLRANKPETYFEQQGMNFRVNTSYLHNSKGEVVGHVELVQDITPMIKSGEYQRAEVERLARNIEMLAQGNVNLDLTVGEGGQYAHRDEENFTKITKSLAGLKDSVKDLVTELGGMAAAQKEGEIDVFASEEKFAGAYRQIVTAANETVRSHIDDILRILNLVGSYAEGDFSESLPDFPGKRIIATQRVNLLRNNLLHVINEMTRMAEAQRGGDIEAYVPEEKFAGAWRQLAEGANEGVRMHVKNILKILGILAAYAEGDFSPVLEKLPGKQAFANEKLDLLRNNLQRVSREVSDLADAVSQGQLSSRGKADAFAGDWRKMVGGINALIEAFVKPINVTAEYVDQIGKGVIPPKISDTYNGDFNTIKDNVNACIDGLGGLVEANDVLQRTAVNDFKTRVEGHYAGIFAEVARATNAVEDRLLSLQKVMQNVGAGEYDKDMEEFQKLGKRSEHDELVPAFLTMMETIDLMVEDIKTLSNSAVAGKLSARADATRLSGKYRSVVEGVNETLDAVVAPIQEASTVLQKIAGGDLRTRVEGKYSGDHEAVKIAVNRVHAWLTSLVAYVTKIANGDMTANMSKSSDGDQIHQWLILMRDNIKTLIAEMAHMSEQHNLGDIDVVIPEDKFEGAYRTMAKGVNEMVEGHITVKKKAMACVAEFGRGNFGAPLETFPGKKAFINETIEQVRANLNALIADTDMLAQAAAAGELATRADASRHQGDFRKILEGVNNTLDTVISPLKAAADTAAALASSSEELNAVSHQMSVNAEETAAQSNVVSAAAEQVTKNLQTVATATEEMSSSIKEIAKNSTEAARVATSAVKTAETTNATVAKLGESSAEIGQVIKVITSIAQQTNLLALNATIEAARAAKPARALRWWPTK